MSTRTRELFTTIHTEGGLLPVDLLQRIAEGDRDLEGLTPESYHLTSGERINEAVNRAWNRVVSAWVSFGIAASKLAENDLGTSLTRERLLLVLFQELGYGRLVAARATEIEGKSYPISHFWQNAPIHLVGFRVDLDRRAAGVAGAARMSPHSMVQEFLNRSEDHLWAFVSNGLHLRLLRDNSALTRQAYLEFDLEAMLEGEVYADFVLLWLLCHQSRVEAERPEGCWLERWVQTAQEQGIRALDHLRGGVERSIQALGRGFLGHPANTGLRDKLRSGALDKQDYYRQLLRLVYRLIFLFVGEDREANGRSLLLDPNAEKEAVQRYMDHYSTLRLRRLAERRRGTKHSDLYCGLRIVMEKLGGNEGCPPLGLPALGSFLWSHEAVSDLDASDITNRDFLEAIRALAFTEQERTLRAVDYKNLGPEELGSIYESLLELQPDINADAGTFELKTASGHERKTTGSYYTPTSLIQCLLDTALDPVLDEACKKPDPERAILSLKVCDPAAGSGHFLIAAAHRMARRLAGVRTGEEEPAPEAMRTALRDVIGHCLYGVDINPMAVELCKVSLWMEALEPGKPLSFLDHHIQCGNSLLGATPALLAKGIPDDAFKPIEGDDKKICAAVRSQNKEERKGQTSLFSDFAGPTTTISGKLAGAVAELEATGDDSIVDIHQKEARYMRLAESGEYQEGKLLADAWCAAFMWRKAHTQPEPVTEEVFRRLSKGPDSVPLAIRKEIERLSEEYRFFHWHLAFPEVFRVGTSHGEVERKGLGWSGGFSLMFGNPPWDTLSPDAKEFFSTYEPDVRFQDRDGQRKIIKSLLEDPSIAAAWTYHRRNLYSQVHFFKNSGRYRLFAPGNLGKGDFNVFRMFMETALQAVSLKGRVSQIVPEGFYNGANCMAIRKELFEHCELQLILGFENAREVWFNGIDSRMKFAIYTAAFPGRTVRFGAAFNIRSPQQLSEVVAGDSLRLPVSLVEEFSPDAFALMEFGDQRDIDIASRIYSRWPKFGDKRAQPPYRDYMREISMGSDRDIFTVDPSGLPVYEGRMVWQYDHRTKGYRSGRGRAALWEDLSFEEQKKSIQPQWYISPEQIPEKARARVEKYRIGFCEIASPTNERSLVASLIPPSCICGHKVPTITFPSSYEWAYIPWLAVANTFAIDFLVRMKVSLTVSSTLLDSLPFPRLQLDHPSVSRLAPLVLSLICTGPEMVGYWNSMAALGFVEPVRQGAATPGLVGEMERLRARAEIEVLVALDLFDLTREEVSYILETFPIVKRKDEKIHGEYRTKRVILEVYDAMQKAIETGAPYQTLLDPPPADPRVAHPPREKAAAVVLPFRRVQPQADEEYQKCVPLVSVKAAAGMFSSEHAVEFGDWVEIESSHRLREGMFVAQVVGRSMEPKIPDGSYCLFRAPVEGSRQGKILLVQHRDIHDPETGQRYTVKRYQSEKARHGDSWRHSKIILKPVNPDFEPIVLTGDDEGELQVVAEFVEVLGGES